MKAFQLCLLLFLFWIVLTGSLEPGRLLPGVILSALIGLLAERTLWRGDDAPFMTPPAAARFLAYLPYLAGEIIAANISVARTVLSPRLPIDPVVITRECGLKRAASRVTLANSITLTPGTLTLELDDSRISVHCLDTRYAKELSDGSLEARVARVFGEE